MLEINAMSEDDVKKAETKKEKESKKATEYPFKCVVCGAEDVKNAFDDVFVKLCVGCLGKYNLSQVVKDEAIKKFNTDGDYRKLLKYPEAPTENK